MANKGDNPRLEALTAELEAEKDLDGAAREILSNLLGTAQFYLNSKYSTPGRARQAVWLMGQIETVLYKRQQRQATPKRTRKAVA